jgi:micrococcal nuclease
MPLRVYESLGSSGRRGLSTFILSIVVGLGAVFSEEIAVSTISAEPPKSLAAERVVRVIDGDTVELNRGGSLVRCRLIGVDAPEATTKVEPYGPEATAYLRGWIEGKTVRVDYERRIRGEPERDRYGRLLVYLLADRGRQSVNIALVERGIARFYGDFPTRYRAAFKAAEKSARDRGLGLWAQSSPSFLPGVFP